MHDPSRLGDRDMDGAEALVKDGIMTEQVRPEDEGDDDDEAADVAEVDGAFGEGDMAAVSQAELERDSGMVVMDNPAVKNGKDAG